MHDLKLKPFHHSSPTFKTISQRRFFSTPSRCMALESHANPYGKSSTIEVNMGRKGRRDVEEHEEGLESEDVKSIELGKPSKFWLYSFCSLDDRTFGVPWTFNATYIYIYTKWVSFFSVALGMNLHQIKTSCQGTFKESFACVKRLEVKDSGYLSFSGLLQSL